MGWCWRSCLFPEWFPRNKKKWLWLFFNTDTRVLYKLFQQNRIQNLWIYLRRITRLVIFCWTITLTDVQFLLSYWAGSFEHTILVPGKGCLSIAFLVIAHAHTLHTSKIVAISNKERFLFFFFSQNMFGKYLSQTRTQAHQCLYQWSILSPAMEFGTRL